MQNFEYQNPTRIVFGKGTIARLADHVPSTARVLFAFGGGSIRRNGVYDQVKAALGNRHVVEFGGIEPNPRYETCMKAVELIRAEKLDFLLAVGGGSVVDGVKFIAAATLYPHGDPWQILTDHTRPVEAALPLGVVLTLPATGSEMNAFSVVSRESTGEKLAFGSDHVRPRFSILDPETTFTLPPRQVANGIVDAFAHVLEQYMTYPADAPLQDRMAEGILQTLIEEGPRTLKNPGDYAARANLVWSATLALNGLIACGVPQDWSTHSIGHEITALYGLDHAVTLAIIFPSVLRHKSDKKGDKLVQYGERIWGIREGTRAERIEAAIRRTEEFFRSLGVKTTLKENGVTEGTGRIAENLEKHGLPVGENADIGRADVEKIVAMSA